MQVASSAAVLVLLTALLWCSFSEGVVCPSSCATASQFCSSTLSLAVPASYAPGLTTPPILASNCAEDSVNRGISFSCLCNTSTTAFNSSLVSNTSADAATRIPSVRVQGAPGSSNCTISGGLDDSPQALNSLQCSWASGACPQADSCDFLGKLKNQRSAYFGPSAASEHVSLSFGLGCYELPTCIFDSTGANGIMTCPVCSRMRGTVSVIQFTRSSANCSSQVVAAGGESATIGQNQVCGRQCNGHGCCVYSEAGKEQCACFLDPWRGFWSGDSCQQCAVEYDANDPTCRTRKSDGVILFERLGSVSKLPMTFPFLILLMLITLLNVFRRRWQSDRNFVAYKQHDRGLRPFTKEVPWVVDPNGPLFRDKTIPKRPAISKGIVNRREREKTEANLLSHSPM
jgi:hypothetical protein